MNTPSPLLQKIEKGLLTVARGLARFSYPTHWERLEIDENQSVWASYTPDYQPTPPLAADTTADLAIIGGGFTGISTAYHFSRRYPEKRVVLLEAKQLANGASGRNGGMMLNWIYGTGTLSPEMMQRIYKLTNSTIDGIEDIIRTHQLAVSYRRDGCWEVQTTAESAEEAARYAEYLNQLNIPITYYGGHEMPKMLHLRGVHGGILDPNEGQLNGVQYIRALRPVLQAQGVAIYENTPVTKVEEGTTMTLHTPHGRVRAQAILLATNGYTGKLGYFRHDYFPLHSHVLATAPLSADQRAQIGWHTTAGFADDRDRLAYGTCTPEGHIVFGGGHNSAYAYLFNNRTAYPGSPHSAKRAFGQMGQLLDDYLPGTAALPLAHRWTGTLAITLRRNCLIGVRGDARNVYYALGYNGHGVTAANMAGHLITDLYSGQDETWRGLPFVQHPDLPHIPLEPFRWFGYQMMTRLTGRSPREGVG